MALVDASGVAALQATGASLAAASGVAKRYRPAPAKTFQCRGYGECRMVFSRSEHLARHIRKHTGERPFTCHCSKQFSRLDNLRQHAQTVHADKAALNEAMMRDLASLHASMTGQVPPVDKTDSSTSANDGDAQEDSGGAAGAGVAAKRPATKRARGSAVKREPVEEAMAPAQAQRPGTSTGYEGAAGYMDVDADPDEVSARIYRACAR
ncbi:hypothetical protein GGX14DRAFT_373094 [Mycena pura]|uniref:C2H2-type domain-containing protein n=1 Tax=Mycena pura TaxID=153505 RepID=A0AAD6V125_9AGAR|nr:hypothetical protein GGX14DRAFT_373094 [Mycena pura]